VDEHCTSDDRKHIEQDVERVLSLNQWQEPRAIM